jgi:hypothetical protein
MLSEIEGLTEFCYPTKNFEADLLLRHELASLRQQVWQAGQSFFANLYLNNLPSCPNENSSACSPPLLTRPILAPSGNRVLTSESRWHMNLATGAQVQNLRGPACSTGARFPAEVRLDVS